MDGDPGRETESTERRRAGKTTDDRPERPDRGRRRVLAAAGGAATALVAGCSEYLPGDDDDVEMNMSGAGGGDTATPTPPSEVNVVGLQYDRDGSTYEFHVTLRAPTAGGADWWQVETLGGERLARNEFDEPVTGGRFTTSASVTLEDVDAVVVRGHGVGSDYGGQVMLADLTEDFITLERQGDEPESFDDYAFENAAGESATEAGETATEAEETATEAEETATEAEETATPNDASTTSPEASATATDESN